MKFAILALAFASPLAAQVAPTFDPPTPLTVPLAVQLARPADTPMPLMVPHDIDARLVPSALTGRIESTALPDSTRQQPKKRRGRYGAGLIGFGAGALAGIGVAAAAGPYDCACEDPGLDQALVGIAVGGLLGAGIGAALPGSDVEGCSRGHRIGPGILGSVLGAGVFAGAGALVSPLVAVYSIPFGAPLGAALLLKRCR